MAEDDFENERLVKAALCNDYKLMVSLFDFSSYEVSAEGMCT
jgi:hypothetical protein